MKCEYCGKEIAPSTHGHKKYCSITCRNRAAYLASKSSTPLSKRTVKCAVCGKQFTQRTGTEMFCSRECRNEAMRLRQQKYDAQKSKAKCSVCGKEFYSPSGNGKYCSSECRRKGRTKDSLSARARNNAQDLTNKAVQRPTKTLDDWAREAFACGLDYGTYRAMIDRGKTFAELKAQYEQRGQNP